MSAGKPPAERPAASRWHCDLASTPNLTDVERRIGARVGAVGMTPDPQGRRLYFESVSRLAHFTGCADRSARRALRALERVGLVRRIEAGGGRNRPAVYELRLNGAEAARARTWKPGQPEPAESPPGDLADPEPGQSLVRESPKPGQLEVRVSGQKAGQSLVPLSGETRTAEARNPDKWGPKPGQSFVRRILESIESPPGAPPDGSGSAGPTPEPKSLASGLAVTLSAGRAYNPPTAADLARARGVLKVQARRLLDQERQA